jgi:S-adenosylmethionine hydrolase
MTFVSLTSDFGTESQHPGICQLIIQQLIPNARIINVSHDVKRFSIGDSIYHFNSALPHFPPNSVHFLLSNLYGHANQQFLYAFENEQHIFAPDNGSLPLLFGERAFELFKIKNKPTDTLVPSVIRFLSETAKSILAGHKDEIELLDAENIVQEKELSSIFNPNDIVARVLHIDRFENIILNLRKEEFEAHQKNRKFVIQFPNGDEINTISQHYNDVKY